MLTKMVDANNLNILLHLNELCALRGGFLLTVLIPANYNVEALHSSFIKFRPNSNAENYDKYVASIQGDLLMRRNKGGIIFTGETANDNVVKIVFDLVQNSRHGIIISQGNMFNNMLLEDLNPDCVSLFVIDANGLGIWRIGNADVTRTATIANNLLANVFKKQLEAKVSLLKEKDNKTKKVFILTLDNERAWMKEKVMEVLESRPLVEWLKSGSSSLLCQVLFVGFGSETTEGLELLNQHEGIGAIRQ